MTPPSFRRKFRTQPTVSAARPPSIRDSATNGVHFGQAVEVADLRPHRVRGRVDDARDVDLDHGAAVAASLGAVAVAGARQGARSGRGRAGRARPCRRRPRRRRSRAGAGPPAAPAPGSAARSSPRCRRSRRRLRARRRAPPPPPPRPSTCRILMPSMRSIGFTDSRMMPSSLSMSRRRIADSRASGVSRFCASFISRTPFRLDLVADARRQRAHLAPRRPAASASARTAAPAVARRRLLRLGADRGAAARRAPPPAAAPISSMRLRRSAISVSRAVNTRSSSATALARARSAARLRLGLRLRLLGHRDGALLLGQLDRLAPLDLELLHLALLARCAPPRPPAPTAMRARSTASRAPIWARSASCSLSARSRATSARWAARCTSSSRSWASRAYSSSRSMSSAWRSVSRFLLRTWIIVSCSMSLRIFLRRSICSVSRVRPSASKALDGLKNSMRRLVELGERHRLQLEPVLQQVGGHHAPARA